MTINDSSMYATKCDWIQDVEPIPITEYEKDMIKHTKNVEQLLKEEKEEKKETKKETKNTTN